MADKSQTVIFLVRHGQTDQSYTDNPRTDGERLLTSTGHDQVKKVGRYLKDFAPAALFSSPIERCVKTSKIINQQLEKPLKIQTTKDLFETYSIEKENHLRSRVGHIIESIVKKYTGQHAIVVTHQYIVRAILAEFLDADPYDYPCELADVYRLVFAGDKLVEHTRLQPAHV